MRSIEDFDNLMGKKPRPRDHPMETDEFYANIKRDDHARPVY